MAVRPRTALFFAAIAFFVGYGALVASRNTRGFWEPEPDFSASLGAALHAELNVSEGDRRYNNRDLNLPEQASLAETSLYPENPEWWRNRCHGFFSALYRANLNVPYRLGRPETDSYFPELEAVPPELSLPSRGNPASIDHMARYERTFPLDPEEIRTHPVFQSDLPVCLDVAAGRVPEREIR